MAQENTTTTTAAFFDMDRTVIRVNSGVLWMKFLRRRGEISLWRFVRALMWAAQHRLSLLDMLTLSRRMVAAIAGDAESEMIAKANAWFKDEVEPTVSPLARQAIERHRQGGEKVVLLTTSTPYVAGPLGQALSMPVICSRLEVENGLFTGRIIEPLCYGQGKVERAEHWAAQHGIDLGGSTFYTDSYSDLPMLERVGRPVAINPDPRLARVARRRGWPVQVWDKTP